MCLKTKQNPTNEPKQSRVSWEGIRGRTLACHVSILEFSLQQGPPVLPTPPSNSRYRVYLGCIRPSSILTINKETKKKLKMWSLIRLKLASN